MYTLKKTEKMLAAFLALVMLLGQILVSGALAGNEGAFDPDAEGTTVTEESGGSTPAPDAAGYVRTSSVYAAAEGETVQNGGITVAVSSNETGDAKDGETYTFNIAINDSRVDIEPNIHENDTLIVKVPEFLTTSNVQGMLNASGLFQYFKNGAGDYSFDASTHILTLKFRDLGTGTTVNFNFNLTMNVDASGYDGEGEEEIAVELDRGNIATVTSNITVGIGTGTGDVTTQSEPYIVKNIWKNYHASAQNGGAMVITDPSKPVGYSFTLGIPDNYEESVSVHDDLSGGSLALCTPSGVKLTGDDISSAFQIKVNSTTVKGYVAAFPVTVEGLGTINIARDAAGGFTLIFTDPPQGGNGQLVNVQVIYSALIADGDVTSFKNSTTLTVDGVVPDKGNDSVSAIKYDTNALTVDKFILDGGREVNAIDLTEETSVTFRIKLTQYGTGPMADGTEVVLDTLADCFGYVESSISAGAPFAITYNESSRQVIVKKTGAEPIMNGVYTIDFTVAVNGLAYGGVATNSVGNTIVAVRRTAKLTLDKTWVQGGTIGSGATFTLCRGTSELGRAQSTGNGVLTFYIDADTLALGDNTLELRENVADDAAYGAAGPIVLKVKKTAAGELTFEDGTGAKTVSVLNERDDGVGGITFKKTDSVSGKALTGGEYALYRVKRADEAGDVMIGGLFTLLDSDNGTKTFTGLEYGTYYFVETAAPKGYVRITEPLQSARVTLGKNMKSAEITLKNTLFGEGGITVNKTDGTNAMAGVTFTLRLGNSVVASKITDANGSAAFTGLAAGVYTLTESVPFGYAGFNSPITVTIDEKGNTATAYVTPDGLASGSTGASAVTLNWTNTRLYGTLTVMKLDAADATKKLSGAEFKLMQNGVQTGDAVVTGTDGVAVFGGLAYGAYTLVETKAPDGYDISAMLAAGVSLTIDGANANASYTAYDAATKGSVTVEKKGANGAALKGAVFALLTKAQYTVENTVAMVQSANDGKAVFKGIGAGTYYVYEVSAPDGYVRDEEYHAVRVGLGEAGNRVWDVSLPLSNTQKLFTVRVTKSGGDGVLLSGAKFELRTGGRVMAAAVTNANGTAEFVNVPYGTYTLREITPPEGYVAAADTEVTVDDSSDYVSRLVHVSVVDEYTSLTVTKFSGEKTGEKLAGAKFVIKNALGKYVVSSNGAWTGFADSEALSTVFETGSDGTFMLTHLPLGSYSLVETAAPEGYNRLDAPVAFSVSQKTTAVSVGNSLIRGDLAVVKTDIYSRPLSGIEFEVTSSDGSYSGTLTTDNHGEGGLRNLPYGTYTIRETNTPAGFVPAEESFAITQNAKTMALDIVNEPLRGDIVFTKTDEAGTGLSGAMFMLRAVKAAGVCFAENETGYYAAVAASASDGTVRFANVPYGVYELTEIAAPEGMAKSADKLYVALGGAAIDYVETTDLEDYCWMNRPLAATATVHKTDAVTGASLAGATFMLCDADMTPVGDGNGCTTDANGNISLSLAAGVYFLVETGAPSGYINDETPLRIVSDGKTPISITVKNMPYTGSVIFTKKDAQTCDVLSGAEIKVYKASDAQHANALYTAVTGSDGKAKLDAVPCGEYVAVETIAPAGYETGEDSVKPFTISSAAAGTVVTVDFLNSRTVNWYVQLEKTDAQSGAALPGAVLRVTHDGRTTDYITDAQGMSTAIRLEPGKYAVTEFAAPAGYERALAGWEFEVDQQYILSFDGQSRLLGNTYVLAIPNTPVTGTLRINKTGSDGTELEGARFTVRDASDNAVYFTYSGNGVYEYAHAGDAGAADAVTTQADGAATLTLLPYGSYKLNETAAPAGYDANDAEYHFTISAGSRAAVLNIVNERKLATLRVYKTDSADGNKFLIGAVFEVFRRIDGADGAFSAGESMGEATTGYDGMAAFTLPYGSYIVVEKRAPEGYELDASQMYKFDFDDSSVSREAELTFSNERSVYSLEIYKCDSADATKGLSGAKFSVTDSRGYSIVLETGADGRAALENIAYDTYTVREIEAPAGYELNETVFTVDAQQLTHNRAVEVKVSDVFIEADVSVRKLDAATGLVIQGAEFALHDASDATVRFTIDGDGKYVFDPEGETDVITAGTAVLSKLPAGAYTLVETKAPAGYVCLDAAHPFAVTAANFRDGVACDIFNTARETSVGIMKLDADNDKLRLEGAQFTLFAFDGNGDPVKTGETVTTNAAGIAVFTKLRMGKYRIVETKAPYGYKLWSNPIDFTVDGEGFVHVGANGTLLTELSDEVYIARVVNHALIREITIRKTDASSGAVLAGAQFRVSAADGTYRDYTTAVDGTVKLSLGVGEYTLREISAPSGYAQSQASHTLRVTEEGVLLDAKALGQDNTVSFTNTRLAYSYGVRVFKSDSGTGKPLSGAVFTLKGPSGTFTLTSGSDGFTDTLNLLPGVYTLAETKAPSGYVLNALPASITIGQDGASLIASGADVVYGRGYVRTLSVTNKAYAGDADEIPLNPPKTGEVTDSAVLLAGAVMMLVSFAGLLALILKRSNALR